MQDGAPKMTNLPRGTLVVYAGRRDAVLARVVERVLNPNRRPGVGRVSYVVEPALVGKDGSATFGTFRTEEVAAAKLTVVPASYAEPPADAVLAVALAEDLAAEGAETEPHPEACPGCGRMPGAGVTPSCFHPAGCGEVRAWGVR